MDSNSLSNMSAAEMNAENYHGHYMNDESPPAPGMIRVVGANGKAEWKRYKQYTKDDIVAAIEEVKNGMSALQASRKYGVPSRTLYDKVPMINSLGMQTNEFRQID
ncbi:uncharacterized protein LOC111706877 [Eurytemora carolleeae]|uniref:uncharacterized protein LOC111706877 n=1 Tax=Eurytemora carolleeae TaxID=1294199 RepID=UPI000C76EDDB|nr:uncharacterized protein LOC111706877 [Eurytemora carolleeae]|eukprot:XP_023335576.1 uncharacterized protein LOC111706877 [Eurytemora affinis]